MSKKRKPRNRGNRSAVAAGLPPGRPVDGDRLQIDLPEFGEVTKNLLSVMALWMEAKKEPKRNELSRTYLCDDGSVLMRFFGPHGQRLETVIPRGQWREADDATVAKAHTNMAAQFRDNPEEIGRLTSALADGINANVDSLRKQHEEFMRETELANVHFVIFDKTENGIGASSAMLKNFPIVRDEAENWLAAKDRFLVVMRTRDGIAHTRAEDEAMLVDEVVPSLMRHHVKADDRCMFICVVDPDDRSRIEARLEALKNAPPVPQSAASAQEPSPYMVFVFDRSTKGAEGIATLAEKLPVVADDVEAWNTLPRDYFVCAAPLGETPDDAPPVRVAFAKDADELVAMTLPTVLREMEEAGQLPLFNLFVAPETQTALAERIGAVAQPILARRVAQLADDAPDGDEPAFDEPQQNVEPSGVSWSFNGFPGGPIFLITQVPREHAERADPKPLVEVVERFTATTGDLFDRLHSVMFGIDGYNDDPRELFDIPAGRAYLLALMRALPLWPLLVQLPHFISFYGARGVIRFVRQKGDGNFDYTLDKDAYASVLSEVDAAARREIGRRGLPADDRDFLNDRLTETIDAAYRVYLAGH